MQKNMSDHLIQLFDRLIDNAPCVLSALAEGKHADELYISAPAIIVKYFVEAVDSRFAVPQTKEQPAYRNIIIIPSSDWALSFFHKDYILLNESWMIHQIFLTPLQYKIKCGEDDFKYDAFLSRVGESLQHSLEVSEHEAGGKISNFRLSEAQLMDLKHVLTIANSYLGKGLEFFQERGLDLKEHIGDRIALCNIFGFDFWDMLKVLCDDYEIKSLKVLQEGKSITDPEMFYERLSSEEFIQHLQNSYLNGELKNIND